MIPSRPLDLGGILGESIRISKRAYWRAAVVFLICCAPGYVVLNLGFDRTIGALQNVGQKLTNVSPETPTLLRDYVVSGIDRKGIIRLYQFTYPELFGIIDTVQMKIKDRYPDSARAVILSRLDSIADAAYPPSGKSAEEAIISELSGGILISLGGVFLLALGLLAALGGWYDLACRAFEERAMPLGRILGSTLTWSMWMLLAQIAAIVLSMFIALGVIVGVASVISPVLGALSFFASIICMIYAGVRLMFSGVALVSEESGPIAAIKRSLALTQGIFWRVIGISLICGTTIYIVSAIVQTPLSMAINGDIRWLLDYGRGNMSISQLLGNLKQTIRDMELVYIISSALTAIFFPAFLATFYYDLRTRKEGPLEYPEQQD